MEERIHSIGIGPGSLDFLTAKGKALIEQADVVSGFQAVVDIIQPLISKEAKVIILTYKNQTDELNKVADEYKAGKRCAVVYMGDLHFSGFQMLERVDLALGFETPTVPGISSAQIMASKTRVCFDETTFVTFHRRGDLEPFKKHLVQVLKDDRNSIIIPLPWSFMPKDIAQFLIESGIPSDHKVEVWENLTRNEASWEGQLGDCTQEFSDMSIMLVLTRNPMESQI